MRYIVDTVTGRTLIYEGCVVRLRSGDPHENDVIHARTIDGQHFWTLLWRRVRQPMPGEVRAAERRRKHLRR